MLCIGYAKSAPDEGSASAERTPHLSSLREATLSHKGRGEDLRCDAGGLSPKPLHRPRVEAAGDGRLVAAAFGGNMKPDNLGIAGQR
jgi:hypothetical protein